MPTLEFLTKLTKRKTEMDKSLTVAWRELVAAVADGRDPSPDDAVFVMEQCGKSVEDLDKAVKLLEERRTDAKQVAAGNAAEAEYQEILGAIKDGEDAFKKLQEQHEARMQPLDNRKLNAMTAINMAADAKRRLTETVPAAVKAALTADIDRQIAEVSAQRDEVDKRRKDKRDWLGRMEVIDSRHDGKSQPTEYEADLKQGRADLKALDAEYHGFNAKFEQLQQQRNKALEVLLTPEFF